MTSFNPLICVLKKSKIGVLLFCSTFSVLSFSAQAFTEDSVKASELPFELKELRAGIGESADRTKSNNGKLPTLAMIFQPDCKWCKKQAATLALASHHCQSQLNVTIIGVKGDKRTLKKELRHYDEALPAYVSNRSFLRSIGGYQASPTTLIYDKNGKLVVNKRGFIEAEKLKQVFSSLTRGQCQV